MNTVLVSSDYKTLFYGKKMLKWTQHADNIGEDYLLPIKVHNFLFKFGFKPVVTFNEFLVFVIDKNTVNDLGYDHFKQIYFTEHIPV